jgi:2-polyprenyl-3-methyl-5-hydroxy-6-metoxy-1,4-benzoquinol methylase
MNHAGQANSETISLSTGYRNRVYCRYSESRFNPIAGQSITEFEPRIADLRKFIRSYLAASHDARILDLGCGYGLLLHLLHRAGFRNLAGVEASAQQVEIARRLGVRGVIEGDAMEFLRSSRDASQDVVVAFDVIEHFARDELLALVDEIFRVLRPNGRLIVHAPNGESPFGGRVRWGDLTHEAAFTRQSMSQLLLTCGFRDVTCFEDVMAVSGIKRMGRWLVWQVVRAALKLYTAAETGSASGLFTQNLIAVAVK